MKTLFAILILGLGISGQATPSEIPSGCNMLPSGIVLCPTPPKKPTCNLKAADLPEVRGLKLGMLHARVMDHIKPQYQSNVRERGYIASMDLKSPDEAEGVEMITIDFYEGQLSSLSVMYGSGRPWKLDNKEFAEIIGDRLHLPQAAWESNTVAYTMECTDFTISLMFDTLTLKDTTAAKAKAAIDKAEADRKKGIFRP